MLAMLGEPDDAPLARRFPSAVSPNLLATGAEVAEANVPVGENGATASGEALGREDGQTAAPEVP
eukprot:9029108-Lingulodinium_polyedra.AAC.1